jgi:hypothetical protein
MNWRQTTRSFWHFFWHEWAGYRRPSTVTPEDHAMRQDMVVRMSLLDREIARLDATRDVWTSQPPPHRGPKR